MKILKLALLIVIYSITARAQIAVPEKEISSELRPDGTFWIPGESHAILDGKVYDQKNKTVTVAYVKASDGIRFPVLIAKPIGDSKKFPVVIAFPGSGMEGPWGTRNFADLAEMGKAVVIMVGKRGISPLPIHQQIEFDDSVFKDDFLTLIDEANQTLAFAENLDYVDRDSIHTCGISQGGMIASKLADEHPEIKSCHLISTPLGDAREIFIFQNSNAIETMFKLVDLNKDGKVNKSELKQAVESGFDFQNASQEEVEILHLEDPDVESVERKFSIFIGSFINFLRDKPEWTAKDLKAAWVKQLNEIFDKMEKDGADPRLNKKEVEREMSYRRAPSAADLALKLKVPTHIWQGAIDATANPEDFKALQKRAEEKKNPYIVFHLIPNRGHGLIVGKDQLEPLLQGGRCKQDTILDQILNTISDEMAVKSK